VTELDHFLSTEYEGFRAVYETYNARLAKYNIERSAYDAAIDPNNSAKKPPAGYEAFAFLVAPQIVPSRPCPPDTPKEYWGQKLDFTTTLTWAAA